MTSASQANGAFRSRFVKNFAGKAQCIFLFYCIILVKYYFIVRIFLSIELTKPKLNPFHI